jgi:hypothetical protein
VLNLVSCNALQIRHLGTGFNLDWSSDLLYFSNGLYTHGGGTATLCWRCAALRNLLRLHREKTLLLPINSDQELAGLQNTLLMNWLWRC